MTFAELVADLSPALVFVLVYRSHLWMSDHGEYSFVNSLVERQADIALQPDFIRRFGEAAPGGGYVLTDVHASEITSLLSAGTFFGAIGQAFLADRLGRKGSIIVSCGDLSLLLSLLRGPSLSFRTNVGCPAHAVLVCPLHHRCHDSNRRRILSTSNARRSPRRWSWSRSP